MSNRALWVGLAVAALLWVLSRTPQGQVAVSDIADSVGSAVRGINNNNPLNVEWGDNWDGLLPLAQRTDARFAQFVSMPYGVRAAAIILRNYQRLYNIRTIAGAVLRWDQDPGDNVTAYIAVVSSYMDRSPADALDFEDRATVFSYLRGAMREEIGVPASLLVSDSDVNAGLDLAGFA